MTLFPKTPREQIPIGTVIWDSKIHRSDVPWLRWYKHPWYRRSIEWHHIKGQPHTAAVPSLQCLTNHCGLGRKTILGAFSLS